MNNQYQEIKCRIHCTSSIEAIYQLLDTNEGRKSFWAESAEEIEGFIYFIFPNGQTYTSKIIRRVPPVEFSILYFDSLVTFHLSKCKDKGTDILLINENVAANEYEDIKAGWVSVLLALKAVADFGIDLRNHSPIKNWDTGFVDN